MKVENIECAMEEMFDFITELSSRVIDFEFKCDYNAAFAELEKIKSDDVEQVVHGKWESNGSSVHYCSECGVDINLVACERWKYESCPLCRAKMDLED